jgi:hypothetical protein
MTTPSAASQPARRRWWQVAAAAAAFAIAVLLTVVGISRSTITFALPGGSGSTTFAPGVLASVIDVLCACALLALLVLVGLARRPPQIFWAGLLVPLFVAVAITTYAVAAETPSF